MGRCKAACTDHSCSCSNTCIDVTQARAGLSPGDDAGLREFADAVTEWSRAMGALSAGSGTCARSVLLACPSNLPQPTHDPGPL